ncbi:MAG: hypothetical protein A2Z34_05510 [Planctomycetes bacterium RBG_16_59_8]|nr:MAG: hypothetical protein A2Z34_05510 [Planctomycetes bacterium RBG_16_59_8]
MLVAVIAIMGCGKGDPTNPVGSWNLDASAAMNEAKKAPEYEKQMKEGGEAAAAMMKMMEEMFKTMKMTLDIKADNSFTVTMEAMGKKSSAKGTWKLAGEKLTMTTTEEDGKAKDSPDNKDLTFKDGKLFIEEDGMKMVLTRG